MYVNWNFRTSTACHFRARRVRYFRVFPDEKFSSRFRRFPSFNGNFKQSGSLEQHELRLRPPTCIPRCTSSSRRVKVQNKEKNIICNLFVTNNVEFSNVNVP